MSSKKNLKKSVKSMVFEILNDCDEVIVNEGKNADKADALIDEAVDFHDDVIAKINAAKSNKDFKEIVTSLKETGAALGKKLNAL